MITVTILLILSVLFSRGTVSVLIFVLRVVFYVTRYMYDARRQDFALSASFASIVRKQNCVVEEVKEAEFRSRGAWEIYLLQNLQFRWVK